MSHTIGQDQQDDRQSSNLSQGDRDSPKPQSHTSKSHTALSDADYEFLFNQLLEGVTYGWHDRRIIKFFQQLGERGKQENWIIWLERIGPKLVELPTQSQHQLGMLMIRLGELTSSAVEISQIGARCDYWGRKLVLGDEPTAVWEYAGPDLVSAPIENKEPKSTERAPTNSMIFEKPLEKSLETSTTRQPATEFDGVISNSFDSTIEKKEADPSPSRLDAQTKSQPSIELSEDELLKSGVLKNSTNSARSNLRHPELEIFDSNLENKSSSLDQPERDLPDSEGLSSDLPLAASDLDSASFWDDTPEAIDMQQVMHLIQKDPELARQISQKLKPSSSTPKSNPVTTDSSNASNLELIESWFNLGLKQVSAGELEQAIASWEKALNINPNLSEAWHNRGSALGRLGNYEAAIDSFQNALSIDPDNYQAWNDRAHALYQLQNWAEAADSWSNALKIMPGNYLFWYNRGCALEQLERWGEAIASHEKALEIKPDFQLGRSRYINLVAENSRPN